jgi:hypothetical protein
VSGRVAKQNTNKLEGSKNPYFDFSNSSNINGLRFLYRGKRGFLEPSSLLRGRAASTKASQIIHASFVKVPPSSTSTIQEEFKALIGPRPIEEHVSKETQ